MKITLIPGDGIGPEVTDAATRCVEAAGLSVDWEPVSTGEEALKKEGTPLPESVLESIRRNKVALKGPITTPVGTGFRSVNVALRKRLDLFANVRPAKTIPGVRTRYDNLDLVVIRENLEDLYAGIEYEKGTFPNMAKDTAVSLKIISEKNTNRIANFAFRFAMEHGRKKVTAVHKANILKHTDGYFLALARKVGLNYPQIEFEDMIVDNMCMQLVQKPELYDMLLCPNLYGDIISDLCSGLVGGLGVAPSGNIGDGLAVFEPVHGSAPKYTGMNKTNPTATIMSAVMMLRHLGKQDMANRLENAIREVVKEGKDVTYDIKPSNPVGTKEMANAIIARL